MTIRKTTMPPRRGLESTDLTMPDNSSILNLGSGKDYRDDCVNADIRSDVGADWVMDICKPDNLRTFDSIIANDVLEHVPDLVAAMTNCRDMLVMGGEMHIHVPYDLSYGAWQDPTHVRAFNEKSWLYYTDWAWYLGWKDTKFLLVHLEYRLSDFGKKSELSMEELLRTPRAVDSMYVVLQKVAA
jgi:SAM-dependent methyltransferase